jgi:hypothetical protein
LAVFDVPRGIGDTSNGAAAPRALKLTAASGAFQIVHDEAQAESLRAHFAFSPDAVGQVAADAQGEPHWPIWVGVLSRAVHFGVGEKAKLLLEP